MYFRTTKRRTASGSEVRYLQLAHNEWDPLRGCAVAKILYSFGRTDQLDPLQMRRLAESLLRTFADREAPSAAVEGREARSTAVGEGSAEPMAPRRPAAAGGDPAQPELPAILDIVDAGPYGAGYALLRLWDELRLDDLLLGLGMSEAVLRQAVAALVAHRALLPFLDLFATPGWLRLCYPDLLGPDPASCAQAQAFLGAQADELMDALYPFVQERVAPQDDLIFFYRTAIAVQEASATLCLALTRDGVPVRAWILPAALGDAAVAQRVQEDLAALGLRRCVLIERGGAGALRLVGDAVDATGAPVLTRSGRFRVQCQRLPLRGAHYLVWFDPFNGQAPLQPAGETSRMRWLASTNDPDLQPAILAQGCRQLASVEQCWHKLFEEVARCSSAAPLGAHVAVSLLALLLERIVETRTGMPWLQAAGALLSIKAVVYRQGDQRVLQTTAPGAAASVVLDRLGLAAPPRRQPAVGGAGPGARSGGGLAVEEGI